LASTPLTLIGRENGLAAKTSVVRVKAGNSTELFKRSP